MSLKAQFVKSATRKDEYPKSTLPGVAFLGRSNVGKSSVINSLVGRKNLARISSTPGRTQVINFFNVEDRWTFVDLPGYGYAKVPARVRAQWAPMIEEFLREYETLALVVAVVDSRHAPTELDRQMKQWLEFYRIPFQVVANKVDKLSSNQRRQALRQIGKSLEVPSVIPFSASSGEGRQELWTLIRENVTHG